MTAPKLQKRDESFIAEVQRSRHDFKLKLLDNDGPNSLIATVQWSSVVDGMAIRLEFNAMIWADRIAVNVKYPPETAGVRAVNPTFEYIVEYTPTILGLVETALAKRRSFYVTLVAQNKAKADKRNAKKLAEREAKVQEFVAEFNKTEQQVRSAFAMSDKYANRLMSEQKKLDLARDFLTFGSY
jgi:hypothetical protein